ncbi:hypothetical protein [Streptomyces sp. NPDC127190]|uniref:hypothetical protein n=1 Tax=unclassified Streptomyces TaxID=2593676 RepID=UPI00362D29BA
MPSPLFRRLRRPPTLDLDDIQATVLRARPEPYFGTHAILEITEPAAGRELLRRLAPRVTSAARWDEPQPSWLALALSYQGLVALGLPETSLASFPANFRAGMAARAERLRDTGVNAPNRWEFPFGTPRVHVAVTVFAASEDDWRAEVAAYEKELGEVPGVRLLSHQDFAADGFNVFGYRDGFSQPVVEGSGAEPLPGDGRPIRAGEFVLGYPSETGVPLPVPAPDVLGRNGTYVVFRKYHSHVAAFNKWLHDNASTEVPNASCWPPSWSAAGAAAHPSPSRPTATPPPSAQTRTGSTTSTTPPTRADCAPRSAPTSAG